MSAPNHGAEVVEDGNERCACGAVVEWAEAWERCGAIVVHKPGVQFPVSHAPQRMGGCFDVRPGGG